MDALEFLMERCREALSEITDKEKEYLIDCIASADRIFIFGVGRSGLVGQTFAIRLVQLGLQVSFVGDMTTPILGKNDLLILVSNTGSTMSVVTTAKIARRIGTKVISITANRKSDLAENSDTVIPVCPKNDRSTSILAPLGTVFEDATMLFFDTLVPNLMHKLGSDEKDMRNHHAIWV